MIVRIGRAFTESAERLREGSLIQTFRTDTAVAGRMIAVSCERSSGNLLPFRDPADDTLPQIAGIFS